jgi:hypothetical protein
MIPPYFCISMIISPWKRTWPFFWTILINFTQGWFVPNLIEIGLLVLEKKTVLNVTYVNMVFLIVAPPEPWEPWSELEFTSYQKSFHVNMSSCGSVVLENILNDPSPLLHFCNDLPFREDLALNLKNLEFPWPKDNLNPVWRKLAYCFWGIRFFSI